MLMHAIAHGDCTDTVSGSALEADSGEKFLAAWEFEPALVLYCAWLFSRTLYQLSYRRPTNIFLLHRTRVTINIDTVRLIRDGEKGGKGLWRWGESEIIDLSLHCHHQNDSCIKMGRDESHFNVSLIVKDQVTRQCPETTIFEEKGEPKRVRTAVPPLTSLTPYR